MSIEVLRRTSDTPTVRGQDDARIMRYASGGRNGILKGYAEECGYDVTVTEGVRVTFTVKSGDIIVDGWQCIIDGTETIALSQGSSPTYYSVWLEVDLRNSENQQARIQATSSLAGYPAIIAGDDLTENPTGYKRFLLYHVRTLITENIAVTRVAEILEYDEKLFSDVEQQVQNLNKQLTDEVNTKLDDIEQRLDKLGFKQGVITFEPSQTNNYNYSLTKEGHRVLFELNMEKVSVTHVPEGWRFFINFTADFQPKNAPHIGACLKDLALTYGGAGLYLDCVWTDDKRLSVTLPEITPNLPLFISGTGWEAN